MKTLAEDLSFFETCKLADALEQRYIPFQSKETAFNSFSVQVEPEHYKKADHVFYLIFGE